MQKLILLPRQARNQDQLQPYYWEKAQPARCPESSQDCVDESRAATGAQKCGTLEYDLLYFSPRRASQSMPKLEYNIYEMKFELSEQDIEMPHPHPQSITTPSSSSKPPPAASEISTTLPETSLLQSEWYFYKENTLTHSTPRNSTPASLQGEFHTIHTLADSKSMFILLNRRPRHRYFCAEERMTKTCSRDDEVYKEGEMMVPQWKCEEWVMKVVKLMRQVVLFNLNDEKIPLFCFQCADFEKEDSLGLG